MSERIVIVGSGFAGMYAALSAARVRGLHGVGSDALEIAVVSPEPTLVVRPRLYEPQPETLTADLRGVFDAIDVRHVPGSVERIDTAERLVGYREPGREERTLGYDRLVLAAGSRLFRPAIPGLAEHGFAVDSLAEALALDRHLRTLPDLPDTPVRGTVVVVGGGFTGLEAATEMPARLATVLGPDAATRIVIVDRNATVAHDMGPHARATIEQALRELHVETRLGVGVTALDAGGATLSDGERIECATVVWAAGMRATPLTAQIPAERDPLGRLLVDPELRVPGVPGVFATGDAARAASDAIGNVALMSCQHATRLGAFAGNNAAAELLGFPTSPYHQEVYVTCLDLGAAGAVFTRGWDRRLELVGAEAKAMKREINTVWIYPPPAQREAALASADPERVTAL